MMRTRSYRRWRMEQAKDRAVHLMRVHWCYRAHDVTPCAIGKVARTRTPCSLWCCGNPRHWWKTKDALTVQERQALIATMDNDG